MDFTPGLAALLGSVVGTGASWAIVAWFVKRWMAGVDEAIKELTRAHPTFRTKAEASAEWAGARCILNDHDRRLTKLETICEREHQK